MDYETCLKTTGLENDLPLIDDYVREYGYYDSIPMRTYLKHWYEGKSADLLGIFKNQLVISEPITYREPASSMCKRIEERITHNDEWLCDVVEKLYKISDFMLFEGHSWNHFFFTTDSDLREWQAAHANEHRYMSSLIDCCRYAHYLQENRVGEEYTLKPSSSNYLTKSLTLHAETKPFRVIHQFIKACKIICLSKWPEEFDGYFFTSLEKSVEKFRQIHSQCLNSKCLKGTLCLSIHPLDYMTMSDNDYGWNSCMRWGTGSRGKSRGEYRTGTVEMMTSPYVVVAYLEGDDPWHPLEDERTWSNKKWRELFIVNRNIISGIKGYPYYCEGLETATLQKLARMCEEYGWPAYGSILDTSVTNNELPNDTTLDFSTNIMYNDTENNEFRYMLSNSTVDEAWEVWGRIRRINYSGAAYCFKCGDPLDFDSSYDDCGSLLCTSCDGRVFCADCGSPVYSEDAIDYDGNYYCPDCVSWCDVCGDPYRSQDSEEESGYISFIFDKQAKYWRESTLTTCPDCFEKYKDDTTVIDTSNYSSHLPSYYHYTLRVALPTISNHLKDILANTERDIHFDELVDFSA